VTHSRALALSDLSNNQLNGSIPQSLSSTTFLYLQNNRFSVLPPFLQQQPTLKAVLLNNNSFPCPLPDWCSASPVGDGTCTPCRTLLASILVIVVGS